MIKARYKLPKNSIIIDKLSVVFVVRSLNFRKLDCDFRISSNVFDAAANQTFDKNEPELVHNNPK